MSESFTLCVSNKYGSIFVVGAVLASGEIGIFQVPTIQCHPQKGMKVFSNIPIKNLEGKKQNKTKQKQKQKQKQKKEKMLQLF